MMGNIREGKLRLADIRALVAWQ